MNNKKRHENEPLDKFMEKRRKANAKRRKREKGIKPEMAEIINLPIRSNEKQYIVSECWPCTRQDELGECSAYQYPALKWRNGNCPMATHLVPQESKFKAKERVGQQKHGKKKK